ncbi:MAG: hypothetical protein EOP06_01225 [Proteobacteria bacterium]|nr:MAG: hypothetical protein EOP06_01225 [Pseudomonadota bacterium]
MVTVNKKQVLYVLSFLAYMAVVQDGAMAADNTCSAITTALQAEGKELLGLMRGVSFLMGVIYLYEKHTELLTNAFLKHFTIAGILLGFAVFATSLLTWASKICG